MKTLDQQTRDWIKIRKLCTQARESRSLPARKQATDRLYESVRNYYLAYNQRFDYSNKPKVL